MDRQFIAKLIEFPKDEKVLEEFFENSDEKTFLWVDWREEDDAIVGCCEDILETGTLSADIENADNELGFDLYINYESKRVRAPLVGGEGDRHITIITMNELLKPDFEIRLCIASSGADMLAFLPLRCSEWKELEEKYGAERVAIAFYPLQREPNVITDELPF